MRDAGYTLVEMLVALAVVGMTAAGLAEGAHVMTRIQGQTTTALRRERATMALQSRFTQFLNGRGPFGSSDGEAGLQGSADELSFPCGEETCTAQLIAAPAGLSLDLGLEDGSHSSLVLPGVTGGSFAYDDGKAQRSDWPPSDAGLRLRSVTIMAGFEPDQRPLVVASLDIAQAPDCEFDPIVKACRARSHG